MRSRQQLRLVPLVTLFALFGNLTSCETRTILGTSGAVLVEIETARLRVGDYLAYEIRNHGSRSARFSTCSDAPVPQWVHVESWVAIHRTCALIHMTDDLVIEPGGIHRDSTRGLEAPGQYRLEFLYGVGGEPSGEAIYTAAFELLPFED